MIKGLSKSQFDIVTHYCKSKYTSVSNSIQDLKIKGSKDNVHSGGVVRL